MLVLFRIRASLLHVCETCPTCSGCGKIPVAWRQQLQALAPPAPSAPTAAQDSSRTPSSPWPPPKGTEEEPNTVSMRRAFAKQGEIDARIGQSPTRVACRVVSCNPGDRFRKAAENEEVYSVLKEALRLNVHCFMLQEAHGFVLDDAAW